MKGFKKLKPIQGRGQGCLHAGIAPSDLPMKAICAVGFGSVEVTRDRKTFWQGDDMDVTLQRFEREAAKDPHHDWRIKFDAPLTTKTYQRQGKKKWVLVKQGMGFA